MGAKKTGGFTFAIDTDDAAFAQLVAAAKAALGKPLIICAINGRPPSWPNVIDTWLPSRVRLTVVDAPLTGVSLIDDVPTALSPAWNVTTSCVKIGV